MDIRQEIAFLKQQRNALILAHNYVIPEIQEIADFCGDSLELSRKASEVKAGVVVFCGVRFMAETAKILSPESTVYLPNSSAGCPMADMASSEDIQAYRKANPDVVLVAYVNSTASTKACVDICCTSGNVEKILNSIPENKKVMFLPDRNLGANMNRKLERNMCLWNGCCPIHDNVTAEMIQNAKKKYPGVPVLVHPESKPEVLALCDYALSTGGMIQFVKESSSAEFVIVTECGILHRLRKENPEKEFYTLSPELVCEDMKKIALEDIQACLRGEREEIVLDKSLMDAARRPIEKMLAVK